MNRTSVTPNNRSTEAMSMDEPTDEEVAEWIKQEYAALPGDAEALLSWLQWKGGDLLSIRGKLWGERCPCKAYGTDFGGQDGDASKTIDDAVDNLVFQLMHLKAELRSSRPSAWVH